MEDINVLSPEELDCNKCKNDISGQYHVIDGQIICTSCIEKMEIKE